MLIIYVGPEVWGQAYFTFRAQSPGRGALLPRTISRSTPHKTPEEKDKLSIGVGQEKNCRHRSMEPYIWQAHTSDHAI